MSKIRILLPVAAAALFFLLNASAATIVWGGAQDISGNTDVVTAGALTYAYAFGNGSVSATTVNTVQFSPFSIVFSNPTIVGNVSLEETIGALIGNSAMGGAGAPFTDLSISYQALLSSGAIGLEPSALLLSMGDLETGKEYLFQVWVNYSATGAISSSFNTQAQAGNTVSLDSNTTDSDGGTGQYVTGTFTADSSVQQVSFVATSGGGTPAINAFQLRLIPEPSTWAMLLGGAGALGAWRLRRRR